MDHEGKQIGEWLNKHASPRHPQVSLGARYNHPIPLIDAQRAIRYVRANADKLKTDPKRVGILGFSAGGISLHRGNPFRRPRKIDLGDRVNQQSCRPDFAVLLYPSSHSKVRLLTSARATTCSARIPTRSWSNRCAMTSR